jgi:hypothetical protein
MVALLPVTISPWGMSDNIMENLADKNRLKPR